MKKLLIVILIISVLVLGVATVFRCGDKVGTQVVKTSNTTKAGEILATIQ